MRSIVCSNSPINGHQFKTRRIDPRPSSFSSRGWVSRRNIGLVSEMKTDGKEYRGSTRRDNTWSIPPSTFWNLPFFVPHFLSFSLSLSLAFFLSPSSSSLPYCKILPDFRRIFPRPGRGKQRVDNRVESNFSFVSFSSQLFCILVFRPLSLSPSFYLFLASPSTAIVIVVFINPHLHSRPKTRVLRIISDDPSTRVVAFIF